MRNKLESASNLNASFSTADAEYPSIQLVSDGLFLEFIDWQERKIKILFSDVVSFSWKVLFTLLENELDDSCYVIKNSNWIEDHIRKDEITPNESYSHYRFNFNEIGQLEVIANSYKSLT